MEMRWENGGNRLCQTPYVSCLLNVLGKIRKLSALGIVARKRSISISASLQVLTKKF